MKVINRTTENLIKRFGKPTSFIREEFERKTNVIEKFEEMKFLLTQPNVNYDDFAMHIYYLNYHEETLITEYWYRIREFIKIRDYRLCSLNFNHPTHNLEVHHRDSYEKLLGYELFHLSGLTTLCHDCHTMITEADKKRKMNGNNSIHNDSEIKTMGVTIERYEANRLLKRKKAKESVLIDLDSILKKYDNLS